MTPPSDGDTPQSGSLTRRGALLGLAAVAATPLVAGRAAAAPGGNRPSDTSVSQTHEAGIEAAADPDLGPNVVIFDPSMSSGDIQAKLNSVFGTQEKNQFGTERYALLFKPGTYPDLDVNVGFYTHVAGLGLTPDEVGITNGWVRVEADWMQGNATQNFWRAAENLSLTPRDGTNRWAVSQAAPLRRVHIKGDTTLWNGYDGWASGGFMADCKVDGKVVSGSQQQWITRNSTVGQWDGSVWNMVFVGVGGAPAQHFPDPSHTVVDQAPVVREKPFLYVDGAGVYQVFVPALRKNSSGATWENGVTPEGDALPLSDFHVVKEGATAATINAALADGKHLLVTPGVYHLDGTIKVTKAGTVVLGLGLATFVPDGGVTALTVADVDGVTIAGILIDAGDTNSKTLMEIGPEGADADHSANPIALQDVFFRIGGAHVGKATTTLVINSRDTLADNLWLWRGDHGDGVGWDVNTADTGLVVNADDVTAYGLFVEHYQKTEVLWNGNGGRTYFFQNEFPYDPPSQSAWMNGETRGYPAYKVADSVTQHQGWGLGSYCNFTADASIVAERSFEVPDASGVTLTDMVIVSLGKKGTINHVVNNTGGPASPADNDGIVYLGSNR